MWTMHDLMHCMWVIMEQEGTFQTVQLAFSTDRLNLIFCPCLSLQVVPLQMLCKVVLMDEKPFPVHPLSQPYIA